jgi:glycosyltransferase involved in cell wall biosynthesis
MEAPSMKVSSSSPAILALLPFLVEGALSLSVLRAMRDRGVKVVVAYFLPEAHGYTRDSAADFERDGCLLDFTKFRNKACLDGLSDAIEQHGIGLVLQIGAFSAYPALPYLKDRHHQVQIVDILYNEIGHTVDHFLYETCLDGVIVESGHMLRFVEGCSAKINPNVSVVKSGIDLDRFQPRRPTSSFGNLILGYVGRMSPEKNPMGFLDLAVRLAADHHTISFVMYGEGAMSEDVRTRAEGLGLGPRLKFEGYISDVQDALASIDVLVVPSRIDGRPNAIMEANAVGRPVLASPIGGIPEMVIDGRNGYLVAPTDTARLSAIIERWTASPAELFKLSQSSRETAEKTFNRRLMLDSYENTFLRFLERATKTS